MKLNTQTAKHLIKKPGQFSLLRHARLAGLVLCFFPWRFAKPFYCLVGQRNEMRRQRPLVLGIQIWKLLLEEAWLILIYLNESVDREKPSKEVSFFIKMYPSNFLTYVPSCFDWWLSPLEFFTLSFPWSPTWFPTGFRLKQLLKHHVALN